MNGLAASQSTLAPNKRLQVHLSHRLLQLQVNSLVTDRVLLQRSLEQLRGELDEERRRREEAEERAARLGREVRDSRFRIHSPDFFQGESVEGEVGGLRAEVEGGGDVQQRGRQHPQRPGQWETQRQLSCYLQVGSSYSLDPLLRSEKFWESTSEGASFCASACLPE